MRTQSKAMAVRRLKELLDRLKDSDVSSIAEDNAIRLAISELGARPKRSKPAKRSKSAA